MAKFLYERMREKRDSEGRGGGGVREGGGGSQTSISIEITMA